MKENDHTTRIAMIKEMIAIESNIKNYDEKGCLTPEAQRLKSELMKKIKQFAPLGEKIKKEKLYKTIDVDLLLTVEECEQAIKDIERDSQSWRRVKDRNSGKHQKELFKPAAEKIKEINKKIEDYTFQLLEIYKQEFQAMNQDEICKKESQAMNQDEICKKELIHGGKRKNAGRKKKEPTIMVRCPESIKDDILRIINRYKETGKIEIE